MLNDSYVCVCVRVSSNCFCVHATLLFSYSLYSMCLHLFIINVSHIEASKHQSKRINLNLDKYNLCEKRERMRDCQLFVYCVPLIIPSVVFGYIDYVQIIRSNKVNNLGNFVRQCQVVGSFCVFFSCFCASISQAFSIALMSK